MSTASLSFARSGYFSALFAPGECVRAVTRSACGYGACMVIANEYRPCRWASITAWRSASAEKKPVGTWSVYPGGSSGRTANRATPSSATSRGQGNPWIVVSSMKDRSAERFHEPHRRHSQRFRSTGQASVHSHNRFNYCDCAPPSGNLNPHPAA